MSIRHPFAVFLCMLMAVALVWSKALLSISMGFLAIIAAVDISIKPFAVTWLLTPSRLRSSMKEKPWLWSFPLITLLYLISIWQGGSVKEWWSLTHTKLAFFLLPLSFALLRPFSRKEYMMIAVGMILMAVWSSWWVQIFFYQDPYLWTESLGFGGSLPTPTHHIRYSVIVAISMIICTSFALSGWTIRYAWERWGYAICALYLFYFLHFLSVRSGLALGYAGIVIIAAFHARRWKWYINLGIVVLFIIAPFVAYKQMPGFREKIHYTIWDFKQFMQGQSATYSDGERWQSWKAGYDIGISHFMFGTGPGKYRETLRQYYLEQFGRDTYTRPHNQFINVFACFGITGLVVFLFAILYPWRYRIFWKYPLFATLYFMQILSCFVEHPLDTEVGTLLFLLFSLLGLSCAQYLSSYSAFTQNYSDDI